MRDIPVSVMHTRWGVFANIETLALPANHKGGSTQAHQQKMNKSIENRQTNKQTVKHTRVE